MAVWLARAIRDKDGRFNGQALHGQDISDAQYGFIDVHRHAGWWGQYVGILAVTGITAGCSTDPHPRYCPYAFVTRAQMATFLVRAFDLPEAGPAGFADVVEGSTHAGDIDRIAAAGITKGCGGGESPTYCPDMLVTRGQMATFLYRALEWRKDSQGLEWQVDHCGPEWQEAPATVTDDAIRQEIESIKADSCVLEDTMQAFVDNVDPDNGLDALVKELKDVKCDASAVAAPGGVIDRRYGHIRKESHRIVYRLLQLEDDIGHDEWQSLGGLYSDTVGRSGAKTSEAIVDTCPPPR